ncbi:MAG: acyl carrier protein [Deltaproteobacteria bacterium]|jgi:acyl carrier protein|nr:acyl carrier protein [Deltaproteobacteria bacterium]
MDRNDEIRNIVRHFLQTDPIYRGLLPANFADDFNLVESGALDSIGIFNLVSFLEKKFGVSIEPQDLNDTYFGTLASIEEFVVSRRK